MKEYYLVTVKYENKEVINQICEDTCNLGLDRFLNRCSSWYEKNQKEFQPMLIQAEKIEFGFRTCEKKERKMTDIEILKLAKRGAIEKMVELEKKKKRFDYRSLYVEEIEKQLSAAEKEFLELCKLVNEKESEQSS